MVIFGVPLSTTNSLGSGDTGFTAKLEKDIEKKVVDVHLVRD